MSRSKEEIKISIKNEGGFRIAPDSKLSTGEAIINDIEITSIENWGKVVASLTGLQQENQELKEDYNKVVHEATEFESKVYELQQEKEKLKAELQLYQGALKREHEAIHRVNDLEEVIDTIKNILNNQMNYREFVDIVNAIEEVIKEVE